LRRTRRQGGSYRSPPDAIDAIGQAARVHYASHVLVAGDVFDTEGPED
jgi:hypothetical protein